MSLLNKAYVMEQLTDWFSGDIVPVHNGVYQRKYLTTMLPGLLYAKFKDGYWYIPAHKREIARQSKTISCHQTKADIRWRGICKD